MILEFVIRVDADGETIRPLSSAEREGLIKTVVKNLIDTIRAKRIEAPDKSYCVTVHNMYVKSQIKDC